MPCYCPENVNAQRGDGVFDSSILALQKLNALGYGRIDDLQLGHARLAGRPIVTGEHCIGCTAGAGSSCQGAVA